MTTITTPAGVFTPTVVRAIDSEQEVGNVVHPLLNGDVDVTFLPPRLRSGELAMGFKDLVTADNCRQAHGQPGTFALADVEVWRMNMSYVPTGRIRLEAEVGSWWCIVGFQEIP